MSGRMHKIIQTEPSITKQNPYNVLFSNKNIYVYRVKNCKTNNKYLNISNSKISFDYKNISHNLIISRLLKPNLKNRAKAPFFHMNFFSYIFVDTFYVNNNLKNQELNHIIFNEFSLDLENSIHYPYLYITARTKQLSEKYLKAFQNLCNFSFEYHELALKLKFISLKDLKLISDPNPQKKENGVSIDGRFQYVEQILKDDLTCFIDKYIALNGYVLDYIEYTYPSYYLCVA